MNTSLDIISIGKRITSIFNLNYLFVNLLPIFIFLILFSPEKINAQTFVPLPVSGFNQDMIAEGSGGINRAEATSTIPFDDISQLGDNVMYSKDFRGNNNPNTAPPFGLPVDRVVNSINLPGANYLLAPYDQMNSLLLVTLNSSGTLTLTTPGVFSKIAFLGASAQGDSDFNMVLNFSDGTSMNTTFTVPDWFDGPNFATQSIGRVHRTTTSGHQADEFNGTAFNPRLYDNQIDLQPPFNTKILTSITFTKTSSGGRTGIFAINGITAINAPDAPVATAGSNVTSNSFTANWLSSPGATSYFLDVSTSSNFSTFVGINNNLNVGNTLSQDITGLSAGTSYYYRVRAGNVSGISPSSNTIEVNFSPCPAGNVTFTTQADVDQFGIDYPNCTEITGNLFIGIGTGTSNITNLSPLSKLTTVGGYLAIYSTSASNLNGLHNLTSILVDIDIRSNSVLSDISALQNTSFNPDGTFGLTIINNPAISVCNLPNFCTYLTNPAATHPRNISGNAGDCITEQAVVDACENATCIVSIPDANFKAYLVANLAINTNGDSEIQCTEAEVYSGAITCPFQNIADLTGIETFVNITNLDCGANQLTNLNLSNNTKLTRVAAATNQLTSLNVNNCVSLQRLYCETNQLTKLNVSTNSDLIELLCVNNKLTSLDFRNNGSLTTLNCSFNLLTKLSLKNGNNTIITSVRTNNNPDLTCIEVDNATFSADNWTGGNYSFDAQHSFSEDCEDVPVMDGDQCTNAVNIQALFGHPQGEPQASQTYTTEGMTSTGNPNTGNDCLDIERKTMWLTFTGDGNRYYIRSNYCSAKVFNDPNGALYTGNCNGGLEQIDCNYWISSSDIDPDANFQFTLQTTLGQTYYILVEVSATDDFVIYDDFGNFCLEVTRLGEECLVQIPDPNFKTYLIENFDINKNGDDEIQCEEAEGYFNQIDCPQLGIQNLKGIEAFIYISGLNCSGNELNSIDLSKNTFLGTLNCSNNNLSNLNLTNNIQLYDIKCFGNRISTLDVSKLEGLDELGCNDNFLVSLDVSKNTILRNLWCYSNQLVYLNVANGSNVNMTMIEANDNPDLTCVQVDDVDYSNENWTGGAFLFDPQSIFSEYCEPCVSSGNISANFLVSSTACIGDDVRVIEYGVFDSIPDPVTFSWDFGNGQKSVERDPIVSYNAPGTYTITLELGNTECPMKLVKDINILSCLKNPKGNAYSEVMPNPSSGPIHLKTRLPLESDAVVSIYDLNGKEIYNKKFSSVDAIDENITIEATGTYILEVRHVLGSEKMKLFVIE